MGSLSRDNDAGSMRFVIKLLLVVAIVGVTAKRAASTAMRGASNNVLSPLEMETVAALVKITAKASSALKGAYPFAPIGEGTCGGAEAMCKSCTSSKKEVKSETAICKAVDQQCVDSLCNDLCLGDAIWTCKVVGKGEWSGRISDAESKALCAQVKGKACSEQAKCCALGEDPAGLKGGKEAVFNGLREWVVSQSGAGDEAGNSAAAFLTGALPLQMCRHDAMDADETDLRCSGCSSGLVLKLEMVDEKPEKACRSFVPMAASGEPPADEDTDFQSLYDRCLKVHTHLLSVRNDAASFFSDALCKCAGCCTQKPGDGLGNIAECPFPTYSIL